jgi:uncharacterized protein YraI
MKTKNILIVAIAPFLAFCTQSNLIATAQQLSNCDVRVVGKERGSRVNLRSGPGTDFGSANYVLVGQIVNMLDTSAGRRIKREDSEGLTWYFVEYEPSKVRGWIREDFVAQQCIQAL